jgi:diaminopimelate epimerase
MSFIDQFLFGNTIHATEEAKITSRQDLRLIDLDLTALIDLIMIKKSNRFYWGKFEKEFINKLKIQSRCDFRVFDFGVNHLAFLVEACDLDSFFEDLRDFSNKFSYWKYFEESEGILSQIIKTKVTMVPLSAFAYLKRTEDAAVLKIEQTAKRILDKETLAKLKTQELIWGKEYRHEI